LVVQVELGPSWPFGDLIGIKPDEAPPFQVWNPPLSDKSAHVPGSDPKVLCERCDVEQSGQRCPTVSCLSLNSDPGNVFLHGDTMRQEG
jgi:hypothetical protein